jgi:hypothetical protein
MQTLVNEADYLIPVHVFCEFFATVTNHRIYKRPSTIEEASHQIVQWMAGDGFCLGVDSGAVLAEWMRLVTLHRVSGGPAYDARIAAVCLIHGVTEFWSADRDFSKYQSLNVVNPLA